MARRFPSGGGDVMRLMLHQMQLNSNSWAAVSNPIMLSEISDASKASKLDPHISKYLDEFLAVMGIQLIFSVHNVFLKICFMFTDF